jgi:hypothetical protein
MFGFKLRQALFGVKRKLIIISVWTLNSAHCLDSWFGYCVTWEAPNQLPEVNKQQVNLSLLRPEVNRTLHFGR